MDKKNENGAPSGTGSRASTEPVPVSALTGFDPSRSVGLTLSPLDLERLTEALRLIGIARGWGHGPGAHCGKGERIAGFYYANGDAQQGDVYPAYCIGAIRQLLIDLGAKVAKARSSTPPTPEIE